MNSEEYVARCQRCYLAPASEHEGVDHPYKVEVYVDHQWAGNALTFATYEAAAKYGNDLLARWFVPTDSRVVLRATGEVVTA